MRKRMVFFYCFVVTAALTITYCGSCAVTVMSENTAVPGTHCIILDAGHGGVDGGTTSCTGKKESAYNLEITYRLNSLLNFMGYETLMIRTSDISVYTKGETIAQKKISDLRERVRIVNETKNAVLLSIHQNYFSDPRYHGAQVFFAKTKESRELAQLIQANLKHTVNPQSTRMAQKSSGVYLMEHIQKTGVLIECGFLSNSEETAKLENPLYQKQLCGVIATSVSSFLSNT